MATVVYTNVYALINAVDLSDHVRQVTINYEADSLEETAMGATTHTARAGLLNWSVSIEFYQDFAASKVDATIFPLVGAAAFEVIIKPVNAAISATNPGFTGNVIVTSYPIIAGSVGDMAVSTVNFQAAGALTRDVTP